MVSRTVLLTTPDLLAKLFRGLGDPTRVRILKILLADGEKTVGELVDALGAPQGRVSTHLACLRWCGFVISYRSGKSVTYTLADPRVGDLIGIGENFLSGHAERVLACQTIDNP
ncbi:MAG: helix-turn-helix transcriptional regulator [Chloroflexi bacterium]|nr:helix-turn-helix transcriptional regulator [Chloroflexota bacterium]